MRPWIWLVLCLAGAAECTAAELSDAQLLATADERIKKHRQAEATVTVVDGAGKPLAGAQVAVEQTRHAFLFGSNIFLWGGAGNEQEEADYRRHFAELFNYATLPFYWPSYEPKQGQPNHEQAEQIARWCRQHQITTKGHPLAWNFADPGWLPEDPAQILALQMARIDDCARRFRGSIDVWDVVNEATHFDRKSNWQDAPKMTAMWKQTGRIEFVDQCFVQARRANPQATLLINDYRVDEDYAQLIEQLPRQDDRPRYDVIGIQSHMHGGAWSNRKIWEVCQRFARFGVPLHFTETTIVSGKQGWHLADSEGSWPSTLQGESTQAREVARFYTMVFSHPAVEGLTWWDFSDRGAWQQAPAGLLREDLSRKPAFYTLLKLIKDQWRTTAALSTDAQGEANFRGFLGQYKVTVTVPDRKPVVGQLFVKKTADNRLELTVP